MTDLELAKAVAKGDQPALIEFIERYHTGVFQYMRGLVRGREDAEDLAIQTMTRAHQKIASYRGESSLKTWVHRVAYREFTHWARRRRPEERLSEAMPAAALSFDRLLEADALRGSLLQLPDTLRQPFILHQVNELSLEEIAVVLDVPVGTVKSRLHYARGKLRELLTPKEEEPYVPCV